MNIALSGCLGAGKSTVCKILEQNGFQIYSMGNTFRSIANDMGLTAEELNKKSLAEYETTGHSTVDDKIDKAMKEHAATHDNFVYDSRLAFWLIPNIKKVFLWCQFDETIQRIYKDSTRKAESYVNIDDCAKSTIERYLAEQERYRKIYGVDIYNLINYDKIIDTTYAAPDKVAECILSGIDTLFISPRSVYPTQSVHDTNESTVEEYMKTDDYSVAVGLYNNNFYVLDGHHRTMAAARNNVAYMKAISVEELKNVEMSDSDYYDFADARGGNIKYEKPSCIKTILSYYKPSSFDAMLNASTMK